MSSRVTAMTHGRGIIHCSKSKDELTHMIFDHEAKIHDAKNGEVVRIDKANKRALSSDCGAKTVKGRRVMRRSNFVQYAEKRAQRIATTKLVDGRLKSVMV